MSNDPITGNETSVAHRWRDQLGGVWLQHAPHDKRGGQAYWGILYSSKFVAFLWMIGHKCDATGVNRRPPAGVWIGNATGSSKDSARRFWMAARALGVIELSFSANGRYVTGYRLLLHPQLNWHACRDELRNDTRRVQQENRRADERRFKAIQSAKDVLATRKLSARADSVPAVVSIESARADWFVPTARAEGDYYPAPEASPHVRTAETVTESARADSPESTGEGSESARADTASPHRTEASPHVRTYQVHHVSTDAMADVLSLPADPQAAEVREATPPDRLPESDAEFVSRVLRTGQLHGPFEASRWHRLQRQQGA